MTMRFWCVVCVSALIILQNSCDRESESGTLSLLSARIGSVSLSETTTTNGVAVSLPITLEFSAPLNPQSVSEAVSLKDDTQELQIALDFSNENKTLVIRPAQSLRLNTAHSLAVSDRLRGSRGEGFVGAIFSFVTSPGALKVLQWTLGGRAADSDVITDAPLDLDLHIRFDQPLRRESVTSSAIFLTGPSSPTLIFDVSEDNMQLTVRSAANLSDLSKYKLTITGDLKGERDQTFSGFQVSFFTAADPTPDFPVITDQELLTLVQQQTFKYFWDFAHPSSGMARERNTSGDIVTSGGSGFGIMSLIVGIERAFISREEGLQRMDQILSFLENADRFHGAWPHWLNGNTGDVVPFSANDNGGDLVETSFLVQGLLTFRQYLDESIATEKALIDRINLLWQGVEWDWYTRGGQNVLYWHWSPDKQWTMNHPIRGYNEALITYFLAAASPTHSVDAVVYHEGWANGGAMVNNRTFYGITLPLGFDYGGPLFFAHYSFLGLDPRGLQDTYANYWTQNVSHSRINHAYCVDNPKAFVGYSDENWGLTASDNHTGYSAHSPTNDLGVITPTAAISSLPYTPDESMKALRFFYYTLGDRLWGPYGFYDAFNITESWTADSYLAIDQGPIIVMIENHRTGLLWDLFMSSPEVQIAMDKLGFTR